MSTRKISPEEKKRLNIALSSSCLKADAAIIEMIELLENAGKTKHALGLKQVLISLRVQYNRASL